MQARWHDPTGAWQRFTVIESEHANKAGGLGRNNGPYIGVALLAHTGCYLEVIEEEGGNEGGSAILQAKVQRQTEYAPRPPTPAQTFVLVPVQPSNDRSINEVCFQSLDGKWRIAAAYGKEPRPGVVLQRVDNSNNNGGDDDVVPPSCRWTVESPAAGLAPLRCGFVLPLHNYNSDRTNDTSDGSSSSSSDRSDSDSSVSSSGSSSELVWFGCGPHESYLDRKAGASVGKWRGPVEQQTFR